MKKNKLVVPVFVLSAFLFFSSAVIAGPERNFVPGELLIQPNPWVSEAKVKAVLKNHGAEIIEEIPRIKVKRIRVPEHALDKVKAALERNPRFSFAEKNFLAQGVYVPDDEKYDSQWHLPKIESPSGWDLNQGASGETIAIIDSGIDPDHPDLAAKLIPGKNFLDESSDTHDVLGHGTAVTGSATAIGDNLEGVAGVAWDNAIMPLVVLSSDNWAYYSDIASAITYAVDNGARVMNISIAGSSSSYTLQNAVDYAWDKGAVIIAAAANESTDTPYYPAACDHVVAVSATDSSDNLASFSNYGSWVDLCAPGTSIVTTNNGGGYGTWNGTSFSSPITAGVVALMFSENAGLTNSELVNLLTGAVDDLGADGFDSTFGHGRLNAYNAVLAAGSSDTDLDSTSPEVSITYPADDVTVSGVVPVEADASDDTAVEFVEFLVDGNTVASDSTSSYSFNWDTADVEDGWHELMARAVDTSGNVGLSSPVNVEVENTGAETDSEAPSVAMSSDRIGSPAKPKFKIEAHGSDNVEVIRMEIYVDGELVASEEDSTIKWMWQTDKGDAGTYEVTAKAYDAAGNVGQISIEISL
ncbi:MAG: S8 family serine peptidase [Desulfurivibrionaceae bacterium]